MQYRNNRFHVIALLAAAGFSAGPAAADAKTPGESDLDRVLDWWAGDYDNDRQIERLTAEGQPVWRADGSGEGGHIEVTSHYRRVELPAFGEHVLYVEETKYGDPDEIFRQRIYTLNVDDESDRVRVKIWNFKDKQRYVGAWRDTARLSDLTPDEMSPLPDRCDLLSERREGRIHLGMNGRDCAFGDRYFNYQVLLGPESFWFRDKIVRLEDDVLLTTAGDFTYHQLDRSD
ncbi:MAG: chromophore lyase CpcT/CpeT [Pseudomonadota bacterium]